MRCKTCGLSRFVFDPDHPPKVAGESVFWDSSVHFDAYVDKLALEGFFERYDRYLPKLELAQGAKILDVGCGLGTFMLYAERKGFSLTGIEADKTAAEICEKNVDGEVILTLIETYDFTPGEFDCIMMWDVIEHLIEPVSAVRQLVGALKSGGKFVFETPNEKFILRKVALLIEKLTGYRLRIGKYFYYVEHKTYFNPDNIRRMLGDMGFSKVEVYQDKSIASREQKIFRSGKFPLAGLITAIIPLVLKLSSLLPNQNKMVVIATKD